MQVPVNATNKLLGMLDAQAEHFRRPPRIYYTTTDVGSARNYRRYVRLFLVMPDGSLEDIGFFVARAVEMRFRATPRDGEYSAELGFRMDGNNNQPTFADIYDLLSECFREHPEVDVRAIEIVTV